MQGACGRLRLTEAIFAACPDDKRLTGLFQALSIGWQCILSSTPSKVGLSKESKVHLTAWLTTLGEEINAVLKDYDDCGYGPYRVVLGAAMPTV
jgi:hypothetical protein